jgi:hypothetical protein
MCAVAPRHLGKGAAARPRCIPPAHRFAGAPRPKSLRALWKPDQETALSWTIALGFRALDHDRCFGTGFDHGETSALPRGPPSILLRQRLRRTKPGLRSRDRAMGFRPLDDDQGGGLGCALVKENGRQRQ